MERKKIGADLLTNYGRIGGHIIISEDNFEWKPVLKFQGSHLSFPISDIESYYKKGSTLILGVRMENDLLEFYTWKGDTIVNTIKQANPNFRMFSTDEVSFSKRSIWDYWWLIIIIVAVAYFIFY